MRKHFIDITEELKSMRSSWKMYSILGLYYKYTENDKTVERKMYINNIHKKIRLETDLDIFLKDAL